MLGSTSRWGALALGAALAAAHLPAVPVRAADAVERPADSALTLTARKMYGEAAKEVATMEKIMAAHRGLHAEAKESELVVAEDAIRKDLQAAGKLHAFAAERLNELKVDLGLNKASGDPDRVIEDPLDYPQVREIQLLRDQVERLYRSGKKFLASLRKPTETKVTRIEPAAEEPIEDEGEEGDGDDDSAADGQTPGE